MIFLSRIVSASITGLDAYAAPLGEVCRIDKKGLQVTARTFCVWNQIGQMARRSTPERSRARVKSDSSQCRCGSRRSKDRRERSELRNTQE